MKVRHYSLEEQIDLWASEYMAPYPELLAKQIDDYTSQDLDWRQIAREKVFPFIESRLAMMDVARNNLVSIQPVLTDQVRQKLGYQQDVAWVIYVGIGCGAGWVTKYQDQPAILFGLENIAECGWSDLNSITGLTAHELGHLVHFFWREEAGKLDKEGPWWQLYTEGFAQRCEHVILGHESWHEADRKDQQDWLDYCEHNLPHLARLFLEQVSRSVFVSDQLLDVRDFFGSWFDIDGYSQTGYYLGHQAVMEMEKSGVTLREIALLDDPKRMMENVILKFSCITSD